MPIRDIRLLKTELRQKYKRIRKNLDPEKQRAMDAEIQTRLLALRQYGENDVIFTYLSKPIEVDTFGLVRAAWAKPKKGGGSQMHSGNHPNGVLLYYVYG